MASVPEPEATSGVYGRGGRLLSQIGCAGLAFAFAIFVFPPALLLLVLVFPIWICQNRLLGRWLPLVGAIYFGVAIPYLASLLERPLWEPIIIAIAFCFCLPGGPVAFLFRPRLRRAAYRAIETAEQEAAPIEYTNVSIESTEPGSTIVRVGVRNQGPGAIFTQRYRVSDAGNVDRLADDGEVPNAFESEAPPPAVSGPDQ